MSQSNLMRKKPEVPVAPYSEPSTNLIYNLLFCDDLELYQQHTEAPPAYPFDVLFSENSTMADLQQIIDEPASDPRVKMLAYNRQLAAGHTPQRRELLGVIVEIGLDEGLDVLASFVNGTARYINYTGRILIWETPDDAEANAITRQLFEHSINIVQKIGPWDQARRPQPARGTLRISFLVSDGLYFGEGPINLLFNDPMANPALMSATALMQYLTQKALDPKAG